MANGGTTKDLKSIEVVTNFSHSVPISTEEISPTHYALTTAGLCVALLAWATCATAAVAPVNPVYNLIDSSIASGKAPEMAWAIKQIGMLLRVPNAYSASYRLQYGWLPSLLKQHDYQAVATLTLLDVVRNPGLTDNVDAVLACRVKAILAMGKKHAALRNAKSLFNICTLADTRSALSLVRQCVAAVYHGHPRIINAFIEEQITGAQVPADEHEPITRCGVLAAVTVKATPYLQKIHSLHGTGNWTILEKGNLLLLADQPRQAIKYFREMEALAGNAKDFLNDENNICRAIKAEDGTIGRANAHLLSSVRSAQKFP